MKLGIMQPYFLPYIGYFQLLNLVDKYVVFDDVNYMKSSWINRNYILLNKQPHLFTINLHHASPNKKINEILICADFGHFLRKIDYAYKKAPFYSEVYSLLELICQYSNLNLASFITNSLMQIINYLGIKTELILSSSLEKDNNLRGEDKILQICELLSASEYYNAVGGVSLYSRENFKLRNIALSFLKSGGIIYKQFGDNFIPNLSIVDVMMFNSPEDINLMLGNYEII